MSRLLVFNFKDFPTKRLKSDREEEKENTDNSLNVNVHFITLCSASPRHQSGFTHDTESKLETWNQAVQDKWPGSVWAAGKTFGICAADQQEIKRFFTWQTFSFYTEIREGKEKKSDELAL